VTALVDLPLPMLTALAKGKQPIAMILMNGERDEGVTTIVRSTEDTFTALMSLAERLSMDEGTPDPVRVAVNDFIRDVRAIPGVTLVGGEP
jgi:hypothetical protein